MGFLGVLTEPLNLHSITLNPNLTLTNIHFVGAMFIDDNYLLTTVLPVKITA